MIKRTLISMLCLAALSWAHLEAGELVTLGFVSQQRQRGEALPETKIVIAEFRDPSGTGVSRSVTHLLWREALVAVGDFFAENVVLADAPEIPEPTGSQDYHQAVAGLLEEQGADFGLWGFVEEGDQIQLTSFLDLSTQIASRDLRLRLADRRTRAPGEATPQAEWLESPIARSQLEFVAPRTSRQDLFERQVITLRRTTIRVEPRSDAEEVRTVEHKTTLQTVDMDGSWFRVLLDDLSVGYVESDMVHVLPKLVQIDPGEAVLREGPGKHNPVVVKMTEGGAFEVLDMRFVPHSGFWYKINAGDREAWVSAGYARPHPSFPVVYFLTGLERFSARRYREAASYLMHFANAAPSGTSKVSLSAAYQLVGAARVERKSVLVLDESALEPFDMAVKSNPEDPTGYLLRCVAALGILRKPERPLDDLRRALELDGQDGQARPLLLAIEKAAPSRVGHQTGLDNAVDLIQQLKADHGIN